MFLHMKSSGTPLWMIRLLSTTLRSPVFFHPVVSGAPLWKNKHIFGGTWNSIKAFSRTNKWFRSRWLNSRRRLSITWTQSINLKHLCLRAKCCGLQSTGPIPILMKSKRIGLSCKSRQRLMYYAWPTSTSQLTTLVYPHSAEWFPLFWIVCVRVYQLSALIWLPMCRCYWTVNLGHIHFKSTHNTLPLSETPIDSSTPVRF